MARLTLLAQIRRIGEDRIGRRATRYSFCHHEELGHQLTVEWTGADRWAIRHSTWRCLGRDGEWDVEPQPSSRTDAWLAAHRFSRDEAVLIAWRIEHVLQGAPWSNVSEAQSERIVDACADAVRRTLG